MLFFVEKWLHPSLSFKGLILACLSWGSTIRTAEKCFNWKKTKTKKHNCIKQTDGIFTLLREHWFISGMHDSDEENENDTYPTVQRQGTDYVQDPHSHRPPRVKSAQRGGEEINSAIQSIKDLRQSLASSAVNTNLTPTAGYGWNICICPMFAT